MQGSGRYPLNGEVHVDAFFVGGEEEGGKWAEEEEISDWLLLPWKLLKEMLEPLEGLMQQSSKMHHLVHLGHFLKSTLIKMPLL